MIVDTAQRQFLSDVSGYKLLPPAPETEDSPPAYSVPSTTSSLSTGTVSLSRSSQVVAPVVPFSTPINGLNIYTKRESISGSWSLDPLAPQVPAHNLVKMFLDGLPEKKCRRSRSKGVPPTAKFYTRHGSIQTTLRVLGDSLARSVATIRLESRSGKIVVDLVSIAPMRTVHIDASSRKGSVTLLVPRSFSGLVQLSSRSGGVELLPVLAASSRVINTRKKETTVLLGAGSMPIVGSDTITDTARIYSRHGRVRLGFSGEDHFAEPPKLMEQAMKLVQKLITSPRP
ncbi:hypothetical protein BJV74DRAFT_833912 [Russula compacta]|nr:hypothetical protein BJV74DRAFT_833912 [Russula compacta]